MVGGGLWVVGFGGLHRPDGGTSNKYLLKLNGISKAANQKFIELV